MSSSELKFMIEFPCELNLTFHANLEMCNDNLTVDDIKETIIKGEKKDNKNGLGDKYEHGVIVVIADSEPCHFYVVTVWKTNGDKKHLYSDKSYRRRKYMRKDKTRKLCSRCGKANLVPGAYPLEISGKVQGEFEGYGCPNCGIVYFNETSSEEIRSIVQKFSIKPLNSMDLSLLLLYSSKKPVMGAISFMKELFLLFKEKLKEYDIPALSPEFIPYHYGPYSFDIVDAWYELEDAGLIVIKGRRSSNKETFCLTEKGKAVAKQIFDSMPEDLKRDLPEWRRGLDELGTDGILKDVYIKYPQYTDKSKIKLKVLPSWMRGRA